MPVWLPFVLLGAGLLAILLEIFIPAGGLLGVAGVISNIVAVVLAYVYAGSMIGNIVLLCALILVPVLIGVGLKLFPRTFFGKLIILNAQLDKGSTEEKAHLIGREGKTLSVLRPSGLIELDNKRYNVVTEGSYVEKGETVRITAIEGSRIVVKKINKT